MGPGTIRVTERSVEFFDTDRRRSASLVTIWDLEGEGDRLWVRRSNAHDWLIHFEDAADAERIAAMIEAGL